jgi:hypothetical protein
MNTPSTPPLVVGLHSPRGGGKDTLFQRLNTLNSTFERRAFADKLKEDTAPLIRAHMGYDPDYLTAEQKEIVRPLWIGWGMACRAMDPLHWVKAVTDQIDIHWRGRLHPFIPVVTDVRFENEATCLREHYGEAFRLIDLTRTGAPPPTDEEEKHYRAVATMADLRLKWGGNTLEEQFEHARWVIDRLGVSVTNDVYIGSLGKVKVAA